MGRMASRILLMLSLSALYMVASSQVAPVYRPGGAPAASKPTATSVKAAPRAIVTGRPWRTRLVTETVYGFLDFTTTVGSTVMVFTPQSETEKASTPSSKKVSIMTATPTSTREKVEATKVPKVEEKRVTTTSTSSSSSTSSNAPTGLARLLQRARTHKDDNSFSFSSKPLRHFLKKSESSGTKSRQFILPNNRRRVSSGGSTIVPITVEGKTENLPSKAPTLEPSTYVPEEIVVSASQIFAPLKVIASSSTESSNEVKSNLQVNNVVSKSTRNIERDYSSINVQSSIGGKPTGLVTTLGGTIISDGQTTIHKTSVIGTYVSGKYAQVLKSTSRIFQDNPSENLITPTHSNYETVKAVIEGSATKFFNLEPTASLPIESLFSSAPERAPRYDNLKEEELSASESKLTKRRGASPYIKDDYYYYYDSKDQFYDDEYDDLVRAGSGLRPSFRPTNPRKSIAPTTPTLRRPEPASTFRPRFKSTGTRNIPPSFLRNSQDKFRNRFQLSANRPITKVTRKPLILKSQEENQSSPLRAQQKDTTEETVRIVSSTPSVGPTNVWLEIITMRSLHTFRVGTNKNTRYVTYTKTFTHSIAPTSALELSGSENTVLYEESPLFENILDDKNSEVATLPPINIEGKDLNSLLKTTTETFRTTETMYKTSVLPVKEKAKIYYHTLTQTYLITRIVSAIKTIPPIEAFEFVPSDSLNEFNLKLLAEGTEHEAALLPGEREYDENKEVRVPPPPGFKLSGAKLADLVGGKFNPEALEKQMNPQLAAAIRNHSNGGTPELSGTKQNLPNSSSTATPPLSPEALQMAYLRLMNPYMFGGLSAQQTVTSSPVVITTDVTTTSTSILRVIFNARPILTTISNIGVKRTTITSYVTATVAAQSPLAGLPFGFPAPLSFPTG